VVPGQDTSPTAPPALSSPAPLLPVDTSSPRATLATFLRLAQETEDAWRAYHTHQSRATYERLVQLGLQFAQLFDLRAVPHAVLASVREDTIAFLLDILGRLELPPLASVPDADAFVEQETPARWRLPGTLLTIVRIEEGPREGEFVFSARTVTRAPALYERIKHRPLRSSTGIDSWRLTLPQVHGLMIPAGLVTALPASLKRLWLDTPLWKILTVVLLGAVALLVLIVWHRVTRPRTMAHETVGHLRRRLTPLAILLVVLLLRHVIAAHVYVIGTFASVVGMTITLVLYLGAVWAFWLVVMALFAWIIASSAIAQESLDADLLRLAARVIGFVGGVVIFAYGAQALGLPIFAVLASLGVGGLAVALALRPTLENLIGGLILYLDQPVRVGDFCRFGDQLGTVEKIGLRSTRVRSLERRLITIPNATFSEIQLDNFAARDQRLLRSILQLRYETTPEQLRYVLAKLRALLLGHPMVTPDPARVRFVGYGAYSKDVELFAYLRCQDQHTFLAIQEDILLRIEDIITEAGTGFAFPSQTAYLSRDTGLAEDRGREAEAQVAVWREQGQLPFPEFAYEQRLQIENLLEYPPAGSPDHGRGGDA
jgi:MscS family membrane protein